MAAVGRLTGMAYALKHEALRAQVREATAASYGWGAGWLRSVADDGQLPMPAEILVVVIHTLTEGLVFQRLMTPDLVPDEVFYAAFAALARPAEAMSPGPAV
jgi:predicted Abi (CAAX) family protease